MTISSDKYAMNGASKYLEKPQSLVNATNDELFSLHPDVITQIQLVGAQKRFENFYPKIKALEKLANEQNIKEINSLDDLAPILFQHTVYKSYPLAFVEKKKFNLLTQWLDKLTTYDLSSIDIDSSINTIDAWMQTIENQTDIELVHSTGTTGKLSFLPRSKAEMKHLKNALYLFMEALTGINPHVTHLPVFFPGYRKGNQLAQRILGTFGPMIAGSEEEFHTAMPGTMSADFMSLAGRMRAAKAKGELGKLQMIKAMTFNRGELLKVKRNRPKWMKEFFENMIQNYKGKRVFLMGTTVSMIEAMIEGEEQGLSNVFAPDSGFIIGGGMKGYTPPPDWYTRLCKFYGVSHARDGYGMTETTGYCPSCEENHYHIYPFQIPFVLDPNGNVLPRKGVQTGRYGFYDLLTESYWGGFVTGDEVTIHWDQCPCGRTGAWLENNIQRIGDKKGGDDKISCAGSQDAYDSFIDYLLELEED
jgi:hypothetical protein